MTYKPSSKVIQKVLIKKLKQAQLNPFLKDEKNMDIYSRYVTDTMLVFFSSYFKEEFTKVIKRNKDNLTEEKLLRELEAVIDSIFI